MGRCGTGEAHCCWFRGEVCQYVTKSADAGFQWACSLRASLPSWEAVYDTEEYALNVKPKLLTAGIVVDCGDWPPKGVKCNDCGEVG